jgi:DNA repair protein RadC
MTIRSEPPAGYAAARASDTEIVREALRILDKQLRATDEIYLTSPTTVRDYLRLQLATRECEIFAVLFLTNRHRVIAFEELFRGTIDGATVHPREVVKEVLRHNAAAVILCHNHPSGASEPSRADEAITRRLTEALALVDVRVLDHLIVGETITSFAERGLL